MPSIIDLIGNTPLIPIKNLNKNKEVQLLSKLEGQNPGGSVKDRAALGMIQAVMESGQLKPGMRLVEATSGNTGIALSMIAAYYKIPITLIMPESATAERVGTMKAYGADVILTPAEHTIEYSRKYAAELVEKGGYHLLNQFANPNNYGMHYKTTGPEIWDATNGKITHFVSSMGTTGTIMGVSRYLKEKNPEIQIIGVQPQDGSRIPGIRRWSPEFLPKIYEPHRVDRIIDVSRNQAIEKMKALGTVEGLFCGLSSGGAMHAALQIANELTEGLIVSIVCDRGDRYLSTGLW